MDDEKRRNFVVNLYECVIVKPFSFLLSGLVRCNFP